MDCKPPFPAHIIIGSAFMFVGGLAAIRMASILSDIYRDDGIWYWQQEMLINLGIFTGLTTIIGFFVMRRRRLIERLPNVLCTATFLAVIVTGILFVLYHMDEPRA